jgi:hypothetical protein
MAVNFATLWAAHPANQEPANLYPCSSDGTADGAYFANQCCIRLGLCFVGSGIDLSSYRGAFCWHGHGRLHPVRAEEMKLWLDSDSVTFVGLSEKALQRRGHLSAHTYYGRTGIVLLRHFWGPGHRGDHIDLWDGSNMTHGDPDYFGRSEEVWFWPLG